MSEIPAHLRWSCRRGMLELDVLLKTFLEEVYPVLTPRHQALFVKLLKSSDQDLFEWFMRKKLPEDPDILFMIEKILHHARTRH